MPDSSSVGEIHYRIVIDNYQDTKRLLSELGNISGGRGAGASASGSTPTANPSPISRNPATPGGVPGTGRTDPNDDGGTNRLIGGYFALRAVAEIGRTISSYATGATQEAIATSARGMARAQYEKDSSFYRSGVIGEVGGAFADLNYGLGALNGRVDSALGIKDGPGVLEMLGIRSPYQQQRDSVIRDAVIGSTESRQDAERNARYASYEDEAGNPRGYVGSYKRSIISAQRSRDNSQVVEQRTIDAVTQNLARNDLSNDERIINQNNLTAARGRYNEAQSKFQDQMRWIERNHVEEKQVEDASITVRERAMALNTLRSPIGARAVTTGGRYAAERDDLLYNEMPAEAARVEFLGYQDIALQKRTYLEGWRGVQYDFRNMPINPEREGEDPSVTMSAFSETMTNLMTLIKTLVSN